MAELRNVCLFALAVFALLIAPSQSASAETNAILRTPFADTPSYTKRALVIGIDHYDNAPNITVGAAGAESVARALRATMGIAAVTLMTDELSTPDAFKPTSSHIKRQINLMLENSVESQTQLVVYFCGRGIRTHDKAAGAIDWLAPSDADPADITGTCVDYGQLKNRITQKQPAKVVLIIDAARPLSSASSPISPDSTGSRTDLAELLAIPPTKGAKDSDPAAFPESLFTHFVVKGLSGDARATESHTAYVTSDSLTKYVLAQVAHYSATHNAEAGAPAPPGVNGFVLSKVGAPAASPADPAPMPTPSTPDTPPVAPQPAEVAQQAVPSSTPSISRMLYTAQAPDGWTQDVSGVMGTDLILLAPMEHNFRANISVIVHTGADAICPPNFALFYNRTMASSMSSWHMTGSRGITVGGYTATIFRGEYWLPRLQSGAHVEEVFVFRGNKAFDITYTALSSNYQYYIPAFQDLLRTMQFVETSQ